MRIGVLIHMRAHTDLKAEFEKARELGLSCCQLCCWDHTLYTPEKAELVKTAAEEIGIEITALWAGWTGPAEWNFTYGPSTLGLVPPAYRGMRLAELMKAADFALWLGVTDLITHVGFLPENPDNPEFAGTVGALRSLCKKLKANGQWFLFETGQETPVTMLRAIEAIGTENVGVNLDTANLLLYGKANTADSLDVFGKYVRNTHCKDGFYPTCGSKLGAECALGEGLANMPLVVKKLSALGYTGPYIIEREISGEKQIEDIKAAKCLLEKIFAEQNLG